MQKGENEVTRINREGTREALRRLDEPGDGPQTPSKDS
jgi:hypothetical protein